MNDLIAQLRANLAATISGCAGWRAAVDAVPRQLFVGDTLYRNDAGEWTPVHRSQLSWTEWLALVYTDTPWINQADHGLAKDAGPGPAGSSLTPAERPTFPTLPRLAVWLLETAGIRVGDKVLGIGTGTGYSTALLCHRLGASAVTSVECDPVTTDRSALTLVGYVPALVQGDELHGYPPHAPYDRLVATCAVRTIPAEWVKQVRAGGTITTPMLGWSGAATLAHLKVAEDGSATGRLVPMPTSGPAAPAGGSSISTGRSVCGTKSSRPCAPGSTWVCPARRRSRGR